MIILLAWQQLIAQWKSGDLRVLLLALILAVSAITTVSFFTNRVAQHLNSQGGQLLGGDLLIVADHPLANNYQQQARQLKLKVASNVEFASMAINGDKNQLAQVKALGKGFPFQGDFGVQIASNKPAQALKAGPSIGEVWLEPRLASAIAVKLRDSVELGASHFKVTGLIMREPSRGGEMFNIAPRLMMHADDVAATQLVQLGSRIKYQLIVAGTPQQIQQFNTWLAPHLKTGERVESVSTARPEIKSALNKAETFLGLAATVSVVLCVVAMLLASEPMVARSMDTAALLRCYGATRTTIQNILLWQTAFIAILGASIGCTLGYALQYGLAFIAGKLFVESLPAPSFTPILIGFCLSFLVLFAVMLPQIMSLKKISVMRIFRRELETKPLQLWLRFVPVALVIALLIVWLAKSTELALIMIAGVLAICLVCGLIAYSLARVAAAFTAHWQSSRPIVAAIKLGLTNLNRRLSLTIAQAIGFSLSAMVLMLLFIVKNDLLHTWQASLPIDAPNRFVINIQANQTSALTTYMQKIGANKPQVFPMVRGRLVAKNNQPISAEFYESERAKQLVSREFNLSTASDLQSDNAILQGRWWRNDEAGKPYISLEEGITKTLNIKVGDTLNFEMAGSQIKLSVMSIRKVNWDSMRANFFAVTPQKTLDNFAASYITAFYLPLGQENSLNQLVQQFPNFTVIDTASLMNQVRDITQKMSLAVAYVFILCLVAGLAVLYAALVATRDTRIREATLLRVLGASRQQVVLAMLTEFAGIALLSSVVASIVANGVAYYVSVVILNLPFHFNGVLALIAFLLPLFLIPFFAWLVMAGYLNQPAKEVLSSI